MNEQRVAAIKERLARRLDTKEISVRDDSHLHAGHEGAKDGRGHFAVRVVAPAFAGMSRLRRHQEVYAAVGDLMKTDIHALSITALTPDEAETE